MNQLLACVTSQKQMTCLAISGCVALATIFVAACTQPEPATEDEIETLRQRGFTLDLSIDPELRRPDGSYEPLSAEKKQVLYKIANRWIYVWSENAKA